MFVDDEKGMVDSLCDMYRGRYNVVSATSANEAMQKIKEYTDERPPVALCVVVSDQRMPLVSGVDLFILIRKICPYTVRILMSAYTDVNSIIQAVNEGHIEFYVTKPFDLASGDLDRVIRRSVAKSILMQRWDTEITMRRK